MAQDSIIDPPHDFNKLRDLIVESRNKMPKRLAQVAAYTIEFPDDIAFGTVSRISEQAAVQPSTLVRFAKALGFSGFSELQAVFQQRLRDRPNNYEARLQAFDAHASGRPPAMALIEGLGQAAIDSIGKFRERIKLELLDEAAQDARAGGNHLSDRPSAVLPDYLISELRLWNAWGKERADRLAQWGRS